MSANQSMIDNILGFVNRMASQAGRVARFSYTDKAFTERQIEGVANYSFANEQNVPDINSTDTEDIVLSKGIRTQGASIGREFQNHFTGRVSFNLNLLVELLSALINIITLQFSRNANEYDPTRVYYPGDIAFVVSFYGGQTIYTWYRRRDGVDPLGTIGIEPTEVTRWELMREYTSLERPIPNIATADLNALRETGLYSFVSGGSPIVVQNAPPLPPGDCGDFMLRVFGDLDDEHIIIQEAHYRDTSQEFTRTLNESGVVQDWFRSKDPKGLEIIGVPGIWTFRVEPNGHLYLYFNSTEPPPVKIDRDPTSPTFNHLIWDFGQMTGPIIPNNPANP